MLDYHEMVTAVEKEHGIKFRGYGGDCDAPYLDFWQLILRTHDIPNPCELEISLVKLLRFQHRFLPDVEEEVIKIKGVVEGTKWISDTKKEWAARNDPGWKMDIIEKINLTFPDAIDKSNMTLRVYIEW